MTTAEMIEELRWDCVGYDAKDSALIKNAADRLAALQALLSAKTEQNEALKAFIRFYEWDYSDPLITRCRECGMSPREGHAPDCRKAKLLEPIE